MDLRTIRLKKLVPDEDGIPRPMTQEQLADESGVDQTTISNLERGACTNPTWGTLTKLAAVLGVKPQDIAPRAPSSEVAS
jgi:transcriptional regulator with XRE-family HTH domain